MTLSLHKISLETFFSSFFCVFFAGEESKLRLTTPFFSAKRVFWCVPREYTEYTQTQRVHRVHTNTESSQSTHKHREYTEYSTLKHREFYTFSKLRHPVCSSYRRYSMGDNRACSWWIWQHAYCLVGWSDLALFCNFKKRALAAKFNCFKHNKDLKSDFFSENLRMSFYYFANIAKNKIENKIFLTVFFL